MIIVDYYKVKECKYGTILAITNIFIKMKVIIRMLGKLIYRYLLACYTHPVNSLFIRQLVFE